MKTLYAYGFLLFVAAPGMLSAQDATPRLPAIPPGPLIQTRAPDFAKWVVTQRIRKSDAAADTGSTSHTPAPAKEAAPTATTTTKTGALILRELTDGSGGAWQTWCVGSLQITLQSGSSAISLDRAGKSTTQDPSPFNVDYSQTDFPDMIGVLLPNYAGIQKFHEIPCLLFKARLPLYYQGPIADIAAYVDLKTRLPVAIDRGNVELIYQFLPAPTEKLTVPPQIQKVIKMDQQLTGSH